MADGRAAHAGSHKGYAPKSLKAFFDLPEELADTLEEGHLPQVVNTVRDLLKD